LTSKKRGGGSSNQLPLEKRAGVVYVKKRMTGLLRKDIQKKFGDLCFERKKKEETEGRQFDSERH